MMAYLAPLSAAFLGLVVGFIGGLALANVHKSTLDRVEESVTEVAGLLIATNTLLGGTLGVLLFQALR
jgi:hypothetical protein